MNYSSLAAMARAEAIRQADADPARTLHLRAIAGSRPADVTRAARRLRVPGPRPSHVVEGEAAPRARLRDDRGPASA